MPAGYADRQREEAEERERDRLDAEQDAIEREEELARAASRGEAGSESSGGLSDFDEASADIPIWGWLSGASARRDAERNRQDQLDAQRAWRELTGIAPSADDLTSNYYFEGDTDEYGDLIGGPSAFAGEGAALRAMRELAQTGGLSDADRGMAQAMRAQQAQALGSANAAAMQQMQARGMGGSGAELAMRMGASEAMNYGNSQADAALQQAAMMRQLGALQGWNQGEQNRRAALDNFNQANNDWRRGREARNTASANRGVDSRAQANQTVYENAERRAAGETNQYQSSQSNRRLDAARQDEANQAGANAIGTIISEIL